MKLTYFRQSFALLTCMLFAQLFFAQRQVLHAYDSGTLRTGSYQDIEVLSLPGANGEEVFAVGQAEGTPENGLLAISTQLGVPVRFLELTSLVTDVLWPEAICETTNGHVIACFYEPDNNASHVYRFLQDGSLLWSRRLPDFRVKDVTTGIQFGGPELIYLTGKSVTNERVTIEALTPGGGGVFAQEYDLDGSFETTVGNELRFDAVNQRLTLVGSAVTTGSGQSRMIALQTNPMGGLIWARSYFHAFPLGFAQLFGRCIVGVPGFPEKSALGFEVIIDGVRRPAMMEIDAGGVESWTFFFEANSTISFFDGIAWRVRGLATDGGDYMLSGSFRSSSNPAGQRSGYSLTVNPTGDGIELHEYETTGMVVPEGTELKDLDFDPVNNKYFFCGEFNAQGSNAGNWPTGPDPQSFWFVSTDFTGDGECSTDEPPLSNQFQPREDPHVAEIITLPAPGNSQTIWTDVSEMGFRQCTGVALKRGHQTVEVDPGNQITIGYAQPSHTLILNVPGEFTEPGKMELLDLQGRIRQIGRLNAGSNEFHLGSLETGIYLVKYTVPGLEPAVKKVFIW